MKKAGFTSPNPATAAELAINFRRFIYSFLGVISDDLIFWPFFTSKSSLLYHPFSTQHIPHPQVKRKGLDKAPALFHTVVWFFHTYNRNHEQNNQIRSQHFRRGIQRARVPAAKDRMDEKSIHSRFHPFMESGIFAAAPSERRVWRIQERDLDRYRWFRRTASESYSGSRTFSIGHLRSFFKPW